MTTADYVTPVTKGPAIAEALGPDYILLPAATDDYKARFVRIRTPEGAILEIAPCCYARRDHFRVSGDYPHAPLHGRLVYSSDNTPEIYISAHKNASIIARDIRRRFLPLFLPVWITVRQRLEAAEAAQAAKVTLYKRLCAAAHKTPDPIDRHGARDFPVHLGGINSGIYGSCIVGSGERVKFDLTTDAETAIKILSCLSEI